ncbi:hypothetical protein [Sphingomonas sp. TZW2008]|uniref:hypothetical protein n=1 Tax=Sphingomonas sp. TZW2008 TaxID=1917973 RepID=UPI001181A13F|nr:hypothetical protein [Sphingomonas sp. TZW2008]
MNAQRLDPFGYWPAQRSRIRGLGGPQRSADGNYVFHTRYVTLPDGPSVATISFEGLSADSGMIVVRIFQHLEGGTPAVTEQGKLTALLPSIAKTGRPLRIPFRALAGAQYAVTGYVFGECVATASAIAIDISPRADEGEIASSRRSVFGRLRARRVAALASGDAPTLSWPVSQAFTQEQIEEAEFRQLMAGAPSADLPTDQWETAYIFRVLEVYGRLVEGARGLSIATASDSAAMLVRQAGCDVTSLSVSSAADDEAGLSADQLGPTDQLFDFVWVRSGVLVNGGSSGVIGAIEGLLDRLRPGGLAIQMVRLSDAFDRHAINRVSLGVAALGHIVAQVRHGEITEHGTPFGIIVRKSTDDDGA